MKRLLSTIIGVSLIIVCGLFSYITLSEWYEVKYDIQTAVYPFGNSDSFYSTADQYATANLVWGILFLIVLFLCIYFMIKSFKLKKNSITGASL
ncbi:MAG: hypothetical protein CMB80_09920 [Flammeovirgaceae bacterium]|nr:hypothetical protein [Flammeovirgaceae bacterium]HCX21554.1 hypothetical protein [Cytophagales bacterium]|tara:strand:+ start:3957 stop:4238 length:282 start_codon:yes stop_codon:yes gene_type:complete